MVPSSSPIVGADGLATDVPVIDFGEFWNSNEKVLEEKELKLKQYIQDNYFKIRNVEKGLANLALEVELTAKPKRQALDHLRKKIETATEKLKVAKLQEQQAKKVWEAAEMVSHAEEANKQSLCEDLTRLVRESTSAQYSRLDELSKRLEALNRGLKGTAAQLAAPDSSLASSPKHSYAVNGQHSVSGGNAVEIVTTEDPSQASKEENGNL